MRTVVVGPGAVGCLIAGLLAETGHDVWLLDKDRRRARAIAANGIRLDEEAGSRLIPVPIETECRRVGHADFLLLCVKAYDTAAAVERARPLVRESTTVASLQNGLGNVECIAAAVGRRPVVAVSIAHGSTSLGDGHVRHAGRGPTLVAALDSGTRARAEQLAALLTEGGIEADVTRDIVSMLWSKLIINAAINPVTAIWNVCNGEILRRPPLRDRTRRAAAEGAAVARGRGVALLYADAAAEAETVCAKTGENVSSMLQDVRRGKRTEADAITGALVAEAGKAGVAVPVNQDLLARLNAMGH